MPNSIKHLKRWIKASFLVELKKFSDGKQVYVEGEQRLTSKQPEFIELRVDGPYISPCGTAGEYKAFIEVNLLGNNTDNAENKYQREAMQGILANMLNRDICIRRTGRQGHEPIDDNGQVGVMRLLPGDMIKVSDFGQIDPNTKVYQSVAEAHYEMYFDL